MERFWLGFLIFGLTALESYVASRERMAERRLQAARSAHWAAAFEVILVVWLLIGTEDRVLIWLCVPGAWLGQWWPVHRRRKRLRARQRREKPDEGHGV